MHRSSQGADELPRPGDDRRDSRSGGRWNAPAVRVFGKSASQTAGFPQNCLAQRADTARVPFATAVLTPEQRAFAEVHAVGLVEKSFMPDSVFMYRLGMRSTERWLVRSDGSAAEHDRFDCE
jgi:hypothetical protein